MTGYTPKRNVAQRLGLPQRQVVVHSSELSDPSRNVGIEVEIENVVPRVLKNELSHIWDIGHDGSLRPRDYSAELKSPVPGYAGKALIDSIDALHNSEGIKAGTFSWRCANHLHIDMRDKTDEDLHMATTMYSLIEPFIFAWDGTGRHESRFGMPGWVCAEDISTATIITGAETNNEFHSSINRFSKYTAMNLAPLARFGTVEFRHAQGTSDRSTIIEYINICLDICNASYRFPNTSCIDLVLEFMVDGPVPFIRRWFEPSAASALLRARMGELPLTQSIFDRSISTALTIAELYQHKSMVAPADFNTDLLSKIL